MYKSEGGGHYCMWDGGQTRVDVGGREGKADHDRMCVYGAT